MKGYPSDPRPSSTSEDYILNKVAESDERNEN